MGAGHYCVRIAGVVEESCRLRYGKAEGVVSRCDVRESIYEELIVSY